MEQTDIGVDQSAQSDRRTELVRPVQGRVIAGVAKGIAESLGINEWIPRLVFIVTLFTGGLGVALYAAGWAFIRSEDEEESAAERFFSGASGARSWIGLGLIILAAVIVLENFTILAGEVILAGALLAIGLLLYMGYLPAIGSRDAAETDATDESKEGVQQMTTTSETTLATTPTGGSPAGGAPVTPPTPTPPILPPRPPRDPSILGRLTIGLMVLGVGVLAILDNFESLPIDARAYHYLALAVTILGIGLLVGSLWGRARWLVLVAVVLVPTLLFSPFFNRSWDQDSFDLQAAPTAFDQIESYDLDIGNLEVDLTGLPWSGQDIVLNANVDVGNLEITLPEGVGIVGQASVNVGEVSEPGRSSGGLGDPSLAWNEPGSLGTVLLDAHVDLGNIEIHR